jgi:murein DD-endopeptidase MepM/ murein hydrolase activator NlpD
MRRGVWLLVLGVVLAALGAASAYAAGATTTTSSTTTSTTTTTPGTTTTPTTTTTPGTTTTTPAPVSGLPASYLSKGCVGAGAAAIAEPGHAVLTLGTPASNRGPSAYPVKASIVRFQASFASGSACSSARVSLTSVSLFGGAVTARSVTGSHGKGTVSGLEVFGSPVGRSAHVGSWGEVTVAKTVGRVTAPLVLQLLTAHRGLPAGTAIAVAFGASAQAVPKSHHHSSTGKGSSKQATAAKKKHRPKTKVAQPLTAVPSLGLKPSRYVFPVAGGASYVDTYGANRNDVYDGWHHGDDLFAPLGTPVVAVARGTLSLVGWNELGGWRLWLTDKKGNSFYYAHLAGYARWILTHPHVRRGQVVGFLGRTGDAFTTTPHLHFEIHPHEPAFVGLGYDGAVDPTTYLQKWRVERVPADEIPQPATLRAPVGAPRQEASVVWQQLLVARHLTSTTGAGAASSSPVQGLASPLALHAAGPAQIQPLESVNPAASASASASESNTALLVGGPLGGLLALSAVAGAFTFRRRRRTAATEPAS